MSPKKRKKNDHNMLNKLKTMNPEARNKRNQGQKSRYKKSKDSVKTWSGSSTDYPCLRLSEEDKRIIMKSLFRKSRQVEENKNLFSSDIIEDTARFEDMFVSIQ